MSPFFGGISMKSLLSAVLVLVLGTSAWAQIPGQPYQIPPGYEGFSVGSLITYGGANYVIQGNGTMLLAASGFDQATVVYPGQIYPGQTTVVYPGQNNGYYNSYYNGGGIYTNGGYTNGGWIKHHPGNSGMEMNKPGPAMGMNKPGGMGGLKPGGMGGAIHIPIPLFK
jgi:hypothetical protein